MEAAPAASRPARAALGIVRRRPKTAAASARRPPRRFARPTSRFYVFDHGVLLFLARLARHAASRADLLRFWGQRAISNRLKAFFRDHAHVFDDDCRSAEQRLEYTACFEEYAALYEELLSQFLRQHDIDEADFLGRCRAAMDCRGASIDTQVLKAVLAGADYRSFIRAMADYKDAAAGAAGLLGEAKRPETPPTAPSSPRGAKDDDGAKPSHARGGGGDDDAKGAK